MIIMLSNKICYEFMCLTVVFIYEISIASLPNCFRLLVSLCLVVLLFTITLVLAKINTDLWQKEFLAVTLSTIVLINIFSAIFQGGLFGLAGCFPSKYMTAVLGGQVRFQIIVNYFNLLYSRVLAAYLLQSLTSSFLLLVAMMFLPPSIASSSLSFSSLVLWSHSSASVGPLSISIM